MTKEEQWFNKIKVADIITLPTGSRYLKPAQNKSYHLDGMFVSLDTGEITHFSRVYEEIVSYEDDKCRGFYGE